MNIEIANRLVELRKKNGLSQEELADKLGLSRQAVSKWERAESSPDTDNLICLAKLYNVSLDDLLNTDQSVEEISTEVKEKRIDENKKKDKYAHLSPSEAKRAKALDLLEAILTGSMYLIALVVYIVVSSYFPNEWGKLWILFLVPIVLSSIVICIKNRRFHQFNYPVMIVILYLFLGLYFDLWHPFWVLFISIPVFYAIFNPIDKYIAEKRGEPIDPEDDDDDEDN